MSINIQTLSNKSEFTNYFSQPITFPQRTMIAMPKANLQLPVFVNPEIKYPNIRDANKNDVCLNITIDGINNDINWNDLYEAHKQVEGIENINGMTFDDYMTNYTFLPNGQLVFLQGGGLETKTSFNTILSVAIHNAYKFYNVTPSSKIEQSSEKYERDIDLYNSPQGPALFLSTEQTELLELGFNVEYSPLRVFGLTPTDMDFSAVTKSNWITGASNEDLTAATGDCQVFANGVLFDYNGGYISTVPNLIIPDPADSSQMCFGLQLVGNGFGGTKIPSEVYETTAIDIGVEFESDTNGNPVYKIITGGTTLYNGTEVVDVSNSTPISPVNTFNNGTDRFYIQVQRGNLYANSSEFIVNILVGSDINNSNVIYSKSIGLISADISIVPVYMADSDAATNGWQFNDNDYIQQTADTQEMGDMNSINHTGSFVIEPLISNSEITSFIEYNFWSSWGLQTKNNSIADSITNKSFISYDGTDLMRTWRNPVNLSNADISYVLGNNKASDIYINDVTNSFIKLNYRNVINNLPQILNVNINNLDIKNFAGTFVGNLTGVTDSKSGDNRLVGTIPFPIDKINLQSTKIDISYEPFNLLYRPMNNPTPFTCNSLQIELYYNDFVTNKRKNIPNINGTMNLEFHIKSGVKPAPVVNGLRPV